MENLALYYKHLSLWSLFSRGVGASQANSRRHFRVQNLIVFALENAIRIIQGELKSVIHDTQVLVFIMHGLHRSVPCPVHFSRSASITFKKTWVAQTNTYYPCRHSELCTRLSWPHWLRLLVSKMNNLPDKFFRIKTHWFKMLQISSSKTIFFVQKLDTNCKTSVVLSYFIQFGLGTQQLEKTHVRGQIKRIQSNQSNFGDERMLFLFRPLEPCFARDEVGFRIKIYWIGALHLRIFLFEQIQLNTLLKIPHVQYKTFLESQNEKMKIKETGHRKWTKIGFSEKLHGKMNAINARYAMSQKVNGIHKLGETAVVHKKHWNKVINERQIEQLETRVVYHKKDKKASFKKPGKATIKSPKCFSTMLKKIRNNHKQFSFDFFSKWKFHGKLDQLCTCQTWQHFRKAIISQISDKFFTRCSKKRNEAKKGDNWYVERDYGG